MALLHFQHIRGNTAKVNAYIGRVGELVIDTTTGQICVQDGMTAGGIRAAKDVAMVAATSSAAGKAGLVPAPAAGKQASFLRGDGTWAVPTNTTYSVMGAATSSVAGTAGLVPAPAAGKQASFLRGDGTWAVPTNTTYSNFVKSGSDAAAGLVPAPSTTAGTTKYLREDGTWAVPPDTNTTYTFTAGISALSWNTEVVLATVGGLEVKAKLPNNPVITYSAGTGLRLSGNVFELSLTDALIIEALGYTPVSTDTTYTTFGASGETHSAGLVPDPGATAGTVKYLREDGTWQVPPDTNTTYSAGTATPLVAGTAAVGSSVKYAREDHVHPAQVSVSGNAGTATKLATAQSLKVALGSTAVVTFDGSAAQDAIPVSGVLPVAYGGTGQTSIANIQAGKDGSGNVIVNTYATKTELSNLAKGVVQTVTVLPVTGSEGVIYLVETTTGSNIYNKYVWESNAFIPLGTTVIDLSNYSQKADTIKALAISGKTITYTKGDNTTGTLVTQDTNTTYSNFVKSGSGAAAGLVPAPSTTAGTTKYLREDGTWQVPPDTNTTYTLSSLGIGNVKNYDQSKAIKAITRSGTTFTYTCLDGTTGTFTQQDNNTTYSVMGAATSSAAGTAGLVPAPAAGKQASFLRGDGTWVVPTNTTYTFTAGTSTLAWNTEVTLATVGGVAVKAKLPANPNTNTWTAFVGATSSAAGTAGYVPAPGAGNQSKFFRGDGTWQNPPNTTYSVFKASGSSHASGLVPDPGATAGTTKYLREDGTWAVPPDTNTTYTLSSLGIGNVKNYDQSKAIKSITRSGTTFTYTCLDNTTGTFTQQDTNTTYTAGSGLTLSGTQFSVKTNAFSGNILNLDATEKTEATIIGASADSVHGMYVRSYDSKNLVDFQFKGSSVRSQAAIQVHRTVSSSDVTAALVLSVKADGTKDSFISSPVAIGGRCYPQATKSYALGAADYLWTSVYANNGTIQTSDKRAKDLIRIFTDTELDAWGNVSFKIFKFIDAINSKGENARLHAGVIAQDVRDIFQSYNLDATKYGWFCYDSWGALSEERDFEGNIIVNARDAGDSYGVRYDELFCIEAAYQRRRAERLERRIADLEAKVETLLNN